jgi:hypothetical protein
MVAPGKTPGEAPEERIRASAAARQRGMDDG